MAVSIFLEIEKQWHYIFMYTMYICIYTYRHIYLFILRIIVATDKKHLLNIYNDLEILNNKQRWTYDLI